MRVTVFLDPWSKFSMIYRIKGSFYLSILYMDLKILSVKSKLYTFLFKSSIFCKILLSSVVSQWEYLMNLFVSREMIWRSPPTIKFVCSWGLIVSIRLLKWYSCFEVKSAEFTNSDSSIYSFLEVSASLHSLISHMVRSPLLNSPWYQFLVRGENISSSLTLS